MDRRNFCKELVSVSILRAYEQHASKLSDKTTAHNATHPKNSNKKNNKTVYNVQITT